MDDIVCNLAINIELRAKPSQILKLTPKACHISYITGYFFDTAAHVGTNHFFRLSAIKLLRFVFLFVLFLSLVQNEKTD